MARIKITNHGSFDKTMKFLKHMDSDWITPILERYGESGVKALSDATPKDTGKTAASWHYTVSSSSKGKYNNYTISWNNSNGTGGDGRGIPIVVLLTFGHGTRNGGYVQGIDFINPAIKPIFEQIAHDAWQEVTNA